MSADILTADRLPPQSREAEMGVIGSVLRDNTALHDVQQVIRADNFYYDAHQKIYQAISDIYNDGQPVDLTILFETLKQRKQLEDVGGAKYLGDLWDAAPTAANAEYYARIVRDKAVVRNLIHANTELLRDAYDGVMGADELLGAAERKILEIAERGTVGETKTLSDALTEAFDRIDAKARGDLTGTGIPSGFVDLDNLTAGLHDNELVIVAARPSIGKCLAADSEILLADGSVCTIGELHRRRRAELLTLGEDWKFRTTSPTQFIDDGLKPVYRVRTRLGRVIETTASHPFRTLKGWQPLVDLRVGDHVAVPRQLPVFGTEPMRECEIKLLGYLIGDGGLSDTCPEFTHSDPRLREDFTRAVHEFGGVDVREDDVNGTRTPTVLVSGDRDTIRSGRGEFAGRLRARLIERGSARRVAEAVGVAPASVIHWSQGRTVPEPEVFRKLCASLQVEPIDLAPGGLTAIRKNGRNPLTEWLDSLGLWGKKSAGKFVPEPVFTLPRPQLALFLNRLFATDGWATVLAEGQTQIGYATVSERLARQVQHLLLRFGVIASLRDRQVKYRGARRPAFQLDITDQQSIRTFAREIGMFGKEDALTRVLGQLNSKRAKACRDVIPAGVWTYLDAARNGVSWAAIAMRVGLPHGTNLHVEKRSLGRGRLRKLADAVNCEPLRRLADSDVYWDRIVSIEPVGVKQVYDLTIPSTHNFVANDVCVHNTAFALNLVRHVVVEEKLPVFFVSLEQAKVELAERLLCCQSRVDSHKLRKGHLSGEDIQKLIAASDMLKGNSRDGYVKLFIDDTPQQTMLRIGANARRLKLKHGLRMIVIDYLQLIEPENRRDPRQEQVAQISRRLKFLARELKIPVIALAQVNRAAEDRQDHTPRLADLRESGSIEQDADTCLMLHRPARFDKSQEDNILEVHVAKQRNGPTGQVTLTYLKQYMRYENYIADLGTSGY
jgi:replicative DNA helicase